MEACASLTGALVPERYSGGRKPLMGRLPALAFTLRKGESMRYIRYRGNGLLWALYSLAVCACLALSARGAAERLGLRAVWSAPALAVAGLLLSLLLFLLLRAISRHFSSAVGRVANCRGADCTRPDYRGEYSRSGSIKKERKGQKIRLWEYLFLFAVLAAAAALRFVFLSQAGIMTVLLAGIDAAFWLRAAFQLAALALLYPALRMLAGRTAAVYVTAAAALLPEVLQGSGEQGGSLYLLLSALYLLQTALLLKALGSPEMKGWPFALLFGLFSGAAACDVIFVGFLLLSLWGILCLDAGESSRERGLAFWLYLGGAAAGFGGMLAVQTFVFHRMPEEFFALWLSGFQPFSQRWPGFLASEGNVWMLLSVLLPACLYIFGFQRQRENRGVLWLPSFLFATAAVLLGHGEAGGRMAALLLWLVMAGMGLHSACCAESAGKAGGESGTSEDGEEDAAVSECGREEVPKLRPGEWIPNPLPVPRRRQLGPMDYAFEPEEGEMHFDLEPSENDDFDIH